MRRLRRAMTGEAMVECARTQPLQHRSGRRRHIAIEHHRHAGGAGGDNRTHHCREFAAAKTPQDLQADRQMIVMEAPGRVQRRAILRAIPASSTPVPGPTQSARFATIKPGGDRRGGCGIADSHFAEAEEIDVAMDGFHAESDGGRCTPTYPSPRQR